LPIECATSEVERLGYPFWGTPDRLAIPDAEPDVADEHDSVTVADDPIDQPAESDARSA
jgi:hypothetical protein